MDYTDAHDRNDVLGRVHNSAQKNAFDGRYPSFGVMLVTNIDDPKKLNRIKGRLQWMNEEGKEFETGWVKQGALHVGETDVQRGVIFGLDMPMPEVHSSVFVFFNGGNPHDGYYWGAPRHRESDREVPRIEKDPKREFCMRWRFANGTEFGIGTEGDAYAIINGHCRVKVQGNLHVSARGVMSFISVKILQAARSVFKRIAGTLSDVQYVQVANDPEVRDMFIDAFDGVPGKADPGIRKPVDLN